MVALLKVATAFLKHEGNKPFQCKIRVEMKPSWFEWYVDSVYEGNKTCKFSLQVC